MEFTEKNRLELTLYRILGADRFRKGILVFERLKHRRDKGKNENYHPSALTVKALKKYSGFMVYNALVHFISLLFVMVYVLLAAVTGVHNAVVDVIMTVMLFIDVYCIILQRANFLRIKAYLCRYIQRYSAKAKLLGPEISGKICQRPVREILDDFSLICRIRDACFGKEDCVIGSQDKECLKRICGYGQLIGFSGRADKHKEKETVRLLEVCQRFPGPYTRLQARADRLGKWLGTSGTSGMGETAVVTEDAECEMLFRSLIPGDSAADITKVCCVLYEIYKSIIDGMEADER